MRNGETKASKDGERTEALPSSSLRYQVLKLERGRWNLFNNSMLHFGTYSKYRFEINFTFLG